MNLEVAWICLLYPKFVVSQLPNSAKITKTEVVSMPLKEKPIMYIGNFGVDLIIACKRLVRSRMPLTKAFHAVKLL